MNWSNSLQSYVAARVLQHTFSSLESIYHTYIGWFAYPYQFIPRCLFSDSVLTCNEMKRERGLLMKNHGNQNLKINVGNCHLHCGLAYMDNDQTPGANQFTFHLKWFTIDTHTKRCTNSKTAQILYVRMYIVYYASELRPCMCYKRQTAPDTILNYGSMAAMQCISVLPPPDTKT